MRDNRTNGLFARTHPDLSAQQARRPTTTGSALSATFLERLWRRLRRKGGLIKETGAEAVYGCSVGMSGNGGQDPHLTGASGSYIFRHGNYDYVNGSIADWTSGYSHTLPNSFYLSSQPSFFAPGAYCTYAWPWVTPTGSNPIQAKREDAPGMACQQRRAGTPGRRSCSHKSPIVPAQIEQDA